MKGDFTRITFDPTKHFTRVLWQQGRVTLDADPNEQAAILLHQLRTMARDLIGPYAAPLEAPGFQIVSDGKGGFTLSPGRYYVDGIMCENETACTYLSQPDFAPPEGDALRDEMKKQTGKPFWLYLDVWERHITYLEDDSIREKALNGPDTCTRTKVVWQVKGLSKDVIDERRNQRIEALKAELEKLKAALDNAPDDATKAKLQQDLAAVSAEIARLEAAGEPTEGFPPCDYGFPGLLPISDAWLTAQVDPGQQIKDPCITSPEAKYRGTENQLYRVEIHRGGKAGDATFKWSRDNGSTVTRWLRTEGADLVVTSTRGFTAGNWVELIDDVRELRGEPGVLVKIGNVQDDRLTVGDAASLGDDALAWSEQLVNPKIRRWDQVQNEDIVLKEGAVPVIEAQPEAPNWIDLADGVQVQFLPDGEYRTGDYWLIPARVATGSIEWPVEVVDGEAMYQAQRPHGELHHFAPLGFLAWNDGTINQKECRCTFVPINSCYDQAQIRPDRDLREPTATPRPESGREANAGPAKPKRRAQTRRPAGKAKP